MHHPIKLGVSLSMNVFAIRKTLVTLTAAGAMGLGSVAAGAPAVADDPVPAPAPVPAQAPAPAPAPAVPAAPGMPDAGAGAANSFLQTFSSILERVAPGAGAMVPSDVNSLAPAATPAAPGAAAPAPAPAPAVE